MASRKSFSGGPWQVIVEEMRSQNRATLEAIMGCRASIEGRLDRIEREWRDRDAALALAIADFRRDLTQHGVETRELKVTVQENTVELRSLTVLR
jgi:hypothetical protein